MGRNSKRFVLGCTAACLFNGMGEVDAAERPNVIYILADDLGYGDIGRLGQKEILTPSLDRMVDEGLLFTQHYAGGPVCGPSRACLMTGMSQAVGHIKGNAGRLQERENLRDEDVTIAEKLKEAGYQTACFGKWGMGPMGMSGYPLNQGFDMFVGYDTHKSAHDYYPEQLRKDGGVLALAEGTYSHDVFTDEALKYLREDHGKPFFMYLAYTIPHGPYNPPDVKPYEKKDWPDKHKKYAAMITRMDRDIGRLLDLLVARGMAENTLVIFASDNGPQSEFGRGPNAMTKFFKSSGGLRGIKRDVFEGGVRVPMIAWWPGRVKVGVTDHVSGFQDLMPTLCELVGADVPKGSDGISMLPTLIGKKGTQTKHDYLYWEFINMGKGAGGRQGVLFVDENVKAVRFGLHDDVRLYDLENDLGEARDISDQDSPLAERLGHYMDEVRSESVLWPREMLEKGWRKPK
ncbi:arylsulfatase [Poriferisphaera sp. WC338]|uniref:arylsulfatase n=1 Tax=Poriferisphaera sp. WC338 TaxID=3425129 RepID=UPI003D815442